VGIGIAFVVCMAANTLIKSVVTNMINPIVGLATGGVSLSQKVICLNSVNHVCKNTFNYGQVISDTFTFLVILFVVYVIIKSLKLDKLDKKKEG
jgi:large conductance mechanosensitive channel